jgi:hypothetical protein
MMVSDPTKSLLRLSRDKELHPEDMSSSDLKAAPR